MVYLTESEFAKVSRLAEIEERTRSVWVHSTGSALIDQQPEQRV
jgi:hypothetical protein